MKYGIFMDAQNLSGMRLGTLVVCDNLLTSLKQGKYYGFSLYRIDSKLTPGTYRCIIQDKSVILDEDKAFDCEQIDPNKHLIVFEPDTSFKKLGTGWVKEMALSKMEEEGVKDTCFFLCSDKEGPKNWNVGILKKDKLHLSNTILDVTKMLDDELTK